MNAYVTGGTIRALREKRNYTQKQLADAISVSDKTVSKWETDRGLPDVTLLEPLAKALKVRKFAVVSDVPGLLRDPNDPKTLLPTLHLSSVAKLKEEGVISGGMLPKIEGCEDAIRAGVRKVHLVDGRMPHSLLLEIFTREGVGTEITDEQEH